MDRLRSLLREASWCPPGSSNCVLPTACHDRSVRRVLGVDIGGVVLDSAHYDEDATPDGPVLVAASEIPGARTALMTLRDKLFGHEIFLVSKCGPRTEARARQWLAEEGFLDAIGISAANAKFCRHRSDKAGICAELGVTHFVDDRLEVLSYLDVVASRYLFQPDLNEVAKFAAHLPLVTVVDGWPALCTAVLARESV